MNDFTHIYLCRREDDGSYIDSVFLYEIGKAGRLEEHFGFRIILLILFNSTKSEQEALDRGRLAVAGLNIIIGLANPFVFSSLSTLDKPAPALKLAPGKKLTYSKTKIIQALIATGGDTKKVCINLNIAYSTLSRHLERYSIDVDEIKNDFIREQTIDILKKTKGNISEAARQLNVNRKTISLRLKKYNLNHMDFRKNGNGICTKNFE